MGLTNRISYLSSAEDVCQVSSAGSTPVCPGYTLGCLLYGSPTCRGLNDWLAPVEYRLPAVVRLGCAEPSRYDSLPGWLVSQIQHQQLCWIYARACTGCVQQSSSCALVTAMAHASGSALAALTTFICWHQLAPVQLLGTLTAPLAHKVRVA